MVRTNFVRESDSRGSTEPSYLPFVACLPPPAFPPAKKSTSCVSDSTFKSTIAPSPGISSELSDEMCGQLKKWRLYEIRATDPFPCHLPLKTHYSHASQGILFSRKLPRYKAQRISELVTGLAFVKARKHRLEIKYRIRPNHIKRKVNNIITTQ